MGILEKPDLKIEKILRLPQFADLDFKIFVFLAFLVAILVEIERGRHPLDAALQVRVAELLAHDRRSHALARRLFANPETVLVDSEQIAMLSAYAIAFYEAETWPLDGYARLLEALLTYHSVKEQKLQRAGDIYESFLPD